MPVEDEVAASQMDWNAIGEELRPEIVKQSIET